MTLVQTEPKKIYIRVDQQGWQPGANTLWYLNLDQSNAVFTDTQGHTINNYGMTYNSNGVLDGCGYSSQSGQYIYSPENSTIPTSFTIMAFIKPTANHPVSDHPLGIILCDQPNKRLRGVGFSQNNSQVQFSYLKENVAWSTYTATPTSGNILNTWHHYALTYNGTTMVGYIDGEQKISQSISGSGSGTNVPRNGLNICGRTRTNESNVNNPMIGYVDEVIVENQARTAQEISDYYNITKGNYGL